MTLNDDVGLPTNIPDCMSRRNSEIGFNGTIYGQSKNDRIPEANVPEEFAGME